MENTGEGLKKIRLEKGISLEEAQKKTKINVNILKAIEEGNTVNLSPVYLKGFLKIYCKFLEVDPCRYISGQHKEPQALEVAKEQKSVVKEKPKLIPRKASLNLKIFRPSKKTVLGFAVILVFAVSLVSFFRLGKSISSRKTVSSVQAVEPQKKQVALPKGKDRATQTVSAIKNSSSGIKLGILAKADCWLTLKSDGRIVFHSILKKGKSESWQAKDKIELSLGNAGAVDLVVNGERILPLGKKGQSVRNIVVTKEGLSVGR